MSSATDELRRMLDERGAGWVGTDYTAPTHGRPTNTSLGPEHHDAVFMEYADGTALRLFDLTPEQAIEATLGRGGVQGREGHGARVYSRHQGQLLDVRRRDERERPLLQVVRKEGEGMSERGKRVVRVLLDRERDADVVERIERQGSITGYLRTLVRRDIHDERLDYAAMKAAEYQAENDKLRELVRDYIDAPCTTCDCWQDEFRCWNYDGADCGLVARAHELGVEA